MKSMTAKTVALILTLSVLTLSSCTKSTDTSDITPAASSSGNVYEPSQNDTSSTPKTITGQIYLYGERHSDIIMLERELDLWNDYYHNNNMRHLFVELPYFAGEYLNLWMQADSDEILEALFADWAGTEMDSPQTKELYKKIKIECPKTVFHGTDVGHEYNTTGERFLRYLEESGQKESEQYALTLKAIEQGKYYNCEINQDAVYRENTMVENFIREFENLGGESVMGIYGGAHTLLDALDYSTNTVPCMANQLSVRYGDAIHSKQLQWKEATRIDTIEVNGTEYEAAYFGKEDMTGFRDIAHREFWRLENAYDDFKDKPATGDELPYNNYPLLVEAGEVFVIDYTKQDGTVIRVYHRSDEDESREQTTKEFLPSPDSVGLAEILK